MRKNTVVSDTFEEGFEPIRPIARNYTCDTYIWRGPHLNEYLFKTDLDKFKNMPEVELKYGLYTIIWKDPTHPTLLPYYGIELPGQIAYLGQGTIYYTKGNQIGLKSRANTHYGDLVWEMLNKSPKKYEIYILFEGRLKFEAEAMESYSLDWMDNCLDLKYTKTEMKLGETYVKKQQPGSRDKIERYLNVNMFDYDCNEKRQKQTGVQLF